MKGSEQRLRELKVSTRRDLGISQIRRLNTTRIFLLLVGQRPAFVRLSVHRDGLIHRLDAILSRRGEERMKPSTEDQIKGAIHEAKGAVKEKAGRVLNNPELEAEGQDEKLAGKVQKKVGQVEKVLEK